MKKKFLLGLLGFLVLFGVAFADQISVYHTYTATDQVTNTKLNGNVSNIVTVVNGNLDNDNAKTSSGFRFYESLGSTPSAGTNGRVVYNTSEKSWNVDDGSAFNNFSSFIWDKDRDTKIQTEESADEDFLRFDCGGTQAASMSSVGLTLENGAAINEFSTDLTLGDSSNTAVPTEKAVKEYIDSRTDIYVGTFTRDEGTASGNQSVTGVGFTPRAVDFYATDADSDEVSWGADDGTTAACVYRSGTVFNADTDDSIRIHQDASNIYEGNINSFDSDGFTVAWTRTGGASGTITVVYIAYD